MTIYPITYIPYLDHRAKMTMEYSDFDRGTMDGYQHKIVRIFIQLWIKEAPPNIPVSIAYRIGIQHGIANWKKDQLLKLLNKGN